MPVLVRHQSVIFYGTRVICLPKIIVTFVNLLSGSVVDDLFCRKSEKKLVSCVIRSYKFERSA